ncbi:hypothetical protein KAI04_05110 [Candidatus Pacearchaeota archaeon]|nr:hypothetical protein [Candidatus Pacearchaeota archaeon]
METINYKQLQKEVSNYEFNKDIYKFIDEGRDRRIVNVEKEKRNLDRIKSNPTILCVGDNRKSAHQKDLYIGKELDNIDILYENDMMLEELVTKNKFNFTKAREN